MPNTVLFSRRRGEYLEMPGLRLTPRSAKADLGTGPRAAMAS